MDEIKLKPLQTGGMEKCAIIFRDETASIIYVCYHCGMTFGNIECTLQHIETHFQLVQITIDEIDNSPEYNDLQTESIDNIYMPPQPDIIDTKTVIKREVDCDFSETVVSNNINHIIETEEIISQCKICNLVFTSKFLLRSHTLRIHFSENTLECDKCGKKFKRNLYLERHLNKHIERHEVSWSCTGDGIRKPLHVEWSESPDILDAKKVCEANDASIIQMEYDTFKCHICSESYSTTNLKDLKNHFYSHLPDEILHINRCKRCDVYFPTKFDLRIHVLDQHLEANTYKCSKCSDEFQQSCDKNKFKEHLRLHLVKQTVVWTNICEGIYVQNVDMANFEETITFSNEQFPCTLCTERFYIKFNLDAHIKCEHSERNKLHCGQCASTFTKLKYYFAHQLEHQRVGPNITESDDNTLLGYLNSRIEEHFVYCEQESSQRPHACLACNHRFTSQYLLRRHVRERHIYKNLPQPIKPNQSKKSKEVICDTCGRKCHKNWILSHLLTHTDIKLHKCSTCGKRFRNKFGKIVHERLHTGEKPFQCTECGKRFQSNTLLTAHKKYHDSTTYPCKLCGRIFNVPSGYRRHIQTHREDKSFQCTVCFQSFNTSVYLKRHMFKHSAKSHQCRFCGIKFNTANGQRQHERCKHNFEADPS